MTTTANLNDDIMGVVFSFISVKDRVSILRAQYHNEFLMEGLMKKTAKQLDVILQNIIGKIQLDTSIHEYFNSKVRDYFNTVGNDISPMKRIHEINKKVQEFSALGDKDGLNAYFKTCGYSSIPRYTYVPTKWTEITGSKAEKAKKIVRIMERAADIASFKQIDCVDQCRGVTTGSSEKNLGELPVEISKKVSEKFLKMYWLIVSILKVPKVNAPKKTERKNPKLQSMLR